jgi:hypothetical protein
MNDDKWDKFGRKRLWPNLRYYAGIYLEIQNKTKKTSISIAGRRHRDLNAGPLGVLPSR